MDFAFRDYDSVRDKEAVHRIWREVGWIEKKEDEEAMDILLEGSNPLVATISGTAESLVATTPGTVRYLEEDLPFSALDGVTTSRVARKRGLAIQLTARAVARDATAGALVCALGMFEQGFYDQIGFGTGSYQHWCSFDPATLIVTVKPRAPQRITPDDWKDAHASRLARRRGHGACNLHAPEITHAEMLFSSNGFGLGYADGPNRELTHYLWASTKDTESGPYRIEWLVYQTRDQFLELLALLKSLGDQVPLVRMYEPPGIQLQDLLHHPLKLRQISEESKYESTIRTAALWQVRICDLARCLERTHLSGCEEVCFNLVLSDPIERFLTNDVPWRGIAGKYTATLGPTSFAEKGEDPLLPTLSASVGAFSRLWLGVRPATNLAWTDDLSGPQGLLEQLDSLLRLPDPKPDWDF
jgi:hypothetical protein